MINSKVCDGLRGDAFVVAQEVGFDNLCKIVDGKPQGIDTLILHVRGMGFSLDRARIKRTIPPLVQTKRTEHEAVCLATTTLLDAPD